MKLVHFDSVGQKQVLEIYESEKEYQAVEAEIEKFWETVLCPEMKLKDVKGRRFEILGP